MTILFYTSWDVTRVRISRAYELTLADNENESKSLYYQWHKNPKYLFVGNMSTKSTLIRQDLCAMKTLTVLVYGVQLVLVMPHDLQTNSYAPTDHRMITTWTHFWPCDPRHSISWLTGPYERGIALGRGTVKPNAHQGLMNFFLICRVTHLMCRGVLMSCVNSVNEDPFFLSLTLFWLVHVVSSHLSCGINIVSCVPVVDCLNTIYTSFLSWSIHVLLKKTELKNKKHVFYDLLKNYYLIPMM